MMNPSIIFGTAIKRGNDHPANLREYIHNITRYWPDGKLLETHAPGQIIETTYEQIYKNSLSIFGWFQEKNISRSNPVILLLDNAHHYSAAIWACILGGYTFVPWSLSGLNYSNSRYLNVLDSLFSQLGPATVLSTPSAIAQLRSMNVRVPLTGVLMIDEVLDHSFTQAIDEQYIDEESTCCMISTSGTTGAPKLVCISHNAIYFRKINVLKLTSNRSRVNLFPFNSITGLNIAFPSSPVSHYFDPSLFASQPRHMLEYVNKNKVEDIILNTYMAAMLCHSMKSHGAGLNLACVKSLSFGADDIFLNVVKNLVRSFNDLNAAKLSISFGYGMTESGIISYKTLQQQQLFDGDDTGATPFLDQITQGMSVRIVDDHSSVIEQGEIGRIQIRSKELLFTRYFNDSSLTENAFQEDGWFNTGDQGMMLDGRLKVTGRADGKAVDEFNHRSIQEMESLFNELPGLYHSMLYICPVRSADSRLSELIIFFVPDQSGKESQETLAASIYERNKHTLAAKIRALVPIPITDMAVTATGKISRQDLLDRYLKSELRFSESMVEREIIDNQIDTDNLSELCRSVLNLKSIPAPDLNLFRTGADSLSIVKIIDEIEQKFKIKIPSLEFYNNPTIDNLRNLIARSGVSTQQSGNDTGSGNYSAADVLNLPKCLGKFIGTWDGTRLFEDGLITALNLSGNRKPIFWVCQEGEEFRQLAGQLGPDQPVYGMRSLVNTPFGSDYSQEIVEMIASRYLWEIMALDVKHPIVLGGNCQAAIIALAMAQMLQKAHKTPEKLILLEWSFNRFKYDGRVLLLYGEYSEQTADIYRGENSKNINWKNDFANHSIASIPCGHGRFFTSPNIEILAGTISENLHSPVSFS